MKVKIKSWPELEKTFGLDSAGDISGNGARFTREMERELPSDRIVELDDEHRAKNMRFRWLVKEYMIEEHLPDIKGTVAEAIKSWLNDQEDKTTSIIVSNGNSYTAQDLIQEIEAGTEVGKNLERNIIELTIDLLFRKKRKHIKLLTTHDERENKRLK